ncbi:T9SS type A sorting domain-containing protein [Aureitalea sp. L0-47]|uniref:T9SS type A sorting domain-containing protein n=1 Tax=Aureitalea sp. L0-47 TaxID=2816962 RepID=UPI002236FFCB|nr:T9SS type A sorting domain-containing protein [Aureitalea sp. L0-47]MCW5518982.1 T9SS type A sorting domain-containing protein [Aureitalea sp. L0-47]
MKNLYSLLIAGVCVFQALAQNPDPILLDTNWYLHEVTVDGTTYPSTGDIFNPGILGFDEDEMSTWISVNAFFSEVLYDPVLDEFETSMPALTLFICDIYCDLEEVYLEDFYFKNGDPQTFSYEIISNAPGYRLIVTDSEGNFAVYGDTILGIHENRLENIGFYPNPAKDILYLYSEGQLISSATVYSLSGQQLTVKSENPEAIDVSSLSEGIYFLEIVTESGRVVKKFVKK